MSPPIQHTSTTTFLLSEKDITIRPAVYSDIPSVMELCRSTGRYVCKDEVSTWMQFDPGCFFVAELANDDRQIIATCCGLRLGLELGKMALYTVHEGYRQRGIGKRIWNRARERLEGRNIGVRALVDKFTYYKERFGFRHDSKVEVYQCMDGSKLHGEGLSIDGLAVATIFEGELVQIQSRGIGGIEETSSCDTQKFCANFCNVTAAIEDGTCTHADSSSSDIDKSPTKLENEGVAAATNMSAVSPPVYTSTITQHSRITKQTTETVAVDSSETEKEEDIQLNLDGLLDGIADYDRRLNNRECSLAVRQNLSWKSCKTKIAISKKDNTVVGYGCFRECISNCWLLSPLYADSLEVAELLLLELLRGFDFSQAPDGIQACFPDKNTRCADLLKKFGFQDSGWFVFTGFTKEAIRLKTDQIYSYHSLDV